MKSDEIEAFYSASYERGEKIRSEKIDSFGYRFTARFLNIGRLKLFELLPLRSEQPADICFLCMDRSRGVIIPDPFHEHKNKLMVLNGAASQKSVPVFNARKEEPDDVLSPAEKDNILDSRVMD
jgi:hypothetical protein